jgi:hypothetical protein
MDSESPLQTDVSPTSDIMQPISDFLRQAGEAQISLRQFIAVKELKDCDNILLPALNKLIKDTVAYYFIGIIPVISDFLFSAPVQEFYSIYRPSLVPGSRTSCSLGYRLPPI